MNNLSGPARIRLVQALARAQVTPFGPVDWGLWAGAEGDAHTVVFHQHDDAYLRAELGITHWPAECCVVILDEGGLSWNGWSPVNAYAWQVNVSLDVENHDVGNHDSVWQVDFDPDSLEARIAQLPHEQRDLVMACPETARPLVLEGLSAANTKEGCPPEDEEPLELAAGERLYARDAATGEFRQVLLKMPVTVVGLPTDAA